MALTKSTRTAFVAGGARPGSVILVLFLYGTIHVFTLFPSNSCYTLLICINVLLFPFILRAHQVVRYLHNFIDYVLLARPRVAWDSFPRPRALTGTHA